MRTTPTTITEGEEPTDAAVRLALGLRPRFYDFGEDTIDPRPCPSWCLYTADLKHEVAPGHPFDAFHSVGTGAEIALSRYPGIWHKPVGQMPGYIDVATLHVVLGQRGQETPVIEVQFRMDDDKATVGTDGLHLSATDARELATALTYFADVADGKRGVAEGSQ